MADLVRWLAVALLAVGCDTGSSLNNENLPPKPAELTLETSPLDGADAAGQELWEQVVQQLGLFALDRSSAIALQNSAEQVAVESDEAILVDFNKDEQEHAVAIAESFQCVEIGTLKEWEPFTDFAASGGSTEPVDSIFTGAFQITAAGVAKALAATRAVNVYLMPYRLRGDNETRTAVLTIPDGEPASELGDYQSSGVAGFPVLLYAHAWNAGFQYQELARYVGNLQANHVVVAPLFPGEPLCRRFDTFGAFCSGANVAVSATGNAASYDSESRDLLGVMDCLNKLALDQNDMKLMVQDGDGNTVDMTSTVQSRLLRHNSSLVSSLPDGHHLKTKVKLPVASIIGAGKGAQAAVAAVSMGYLVTEPFLEIHSDDKMQAYRESLATSGGEVNLLFNCVGLITPQMSLVTGRNRFFLESWVKKFSHILTREQQQKIVSIPGFSILKRRLEEMIAQGDPALPAPTAAAIGGLIRRSDAVYLQRPFLAGINNWGQYWLSLRQRETAPSQARDTVTAANGAVVLLSGNADTVTDPRAIQTVVAKMQTTGTALQEKLQESNWQLGSPTPSWLILGIAPPSEFVIGDEIHLPPGDLGHALDDSFLRGTATVGIGFENREFRSTVDMTNYLDKEVGPLSALQRWYDEQCRAAMN